MGRMLEATMSPNDYIKSEPLRCKACGNFVKGAVQYCNRECYDKIARGK